jgi:hypothetical protein
MSLSVQNYALTGTEAAATLTPKIILKTGEQYNLWKERVSTTCWALTHVDVFTLTDEQCAKLIAIAEEPKQAEGKSYVQIDIVGKCWTVLTSHLSDDLFLKVSHVAKGNIASLIAEIRASLAVSTVEDVQPLRVDLYSANMVRDCKNDLQT